MSLSLTPRFDLFRFCFPKEFLPEEIRTKYQTILNRNAGVIVNPIDYLNESIQAVHIPGISGLAMEQTQREANQVVPRSVVPRDGVSSNRMGRINVEPSHQVVYKSAGNPLDKIERELKITFRMNQGMYNYYMLYETIFYHYVKHINMPSDDVLFIEILNEHGSICGRIVMTDVHIDGLDGLDFSYDKTTRDHYTFDLVMKFNNINFEFIPNDETY